jgi:hypothetical protein
LRRAAREATIAVTVVGHAFLRQPEAIIYKPGELGVSFRALTACVQAASAAFAQASNLKTAHPEIGWSLRCAKVDWPTKARKTQSSKRR